MSRIIIIALCIVLTSIKAHAGEFKEWVQAFGYVIACHESGHAMSGEDVGYPIEMTFDAGGPHYLANNPAYQPDQQLLLQFRKNEKIVLDWNAAIAKGVSPSISYQAVKAAEAAARSEATELRRQALIWQHDTDRKMAYVAGAGFVGQQSCESKLKGSIKAKYLVVSGAFYKVGYAAFPKSLQPGVELGDVEAFRATGSIDVARVALILSGASDIYRGVYDPEARWSVGFYRSVKGQPGLQFVYNF